MKVMSSWDMPDNIDEPPEACPSCKGTGTLTDAKLLPCIWSVNGPLNYISVFQIAKLIDSMREATADKQRHILDLQGCKSVDLTGAEELLTGLHELRKDGVQATLMNVPNQFQAVLDAYKSMGEINAYAKNTSTDTTRPSKELTGSMVDPMNLVMNQDFFEDEDEAEESTEDEGKA